MSFEVVVEVILGMGCMVVGFVGIDSLVVVGYMVGIGCWEVVGIIVESLGFVGFGID